MDFIKYVFNLFITAFWNPDNQFYSFIGWFTTIYTLVTFGVPKMKHWEKKISTRLKQYRVLILGVLIFISLVLSAYTLQSNKNIAMEHRPILNIGKSTEISTSEDEIKEIATFNITFHIENAGDRAAYQFFSRICFAPESRLQNILSYDDLIETNPIQPHEEDLVPVGIDQSFRKSDGTLVVGSETWFIYYLLKYSDAPTGGNWYSDEYWFALSLNDKTVRSLTLEEKQIFQPLVNLHYEKGNQE